MRIKYDGVTFIAVALGLLFIYLCLPFSMVVLNSLLIKVLVITAAACFIMGLLLINRLEYVLSLILLFAFLFIYWKITWSIHVETLVYVYYCFTALAFVLGGIVLYLYADYTLLKKLFWFFTAVYFITAITTLIGLMLYPLAARELGRGSTYDGSNEFATHVETYRRLNIASWSQVYGMVFILPVALLIWKNKRECFFFVFGLVLFVMLMASQLTFAVLLATILTIALVFLKGKSTKAFIITSVAIIIGLAVLINLDAVLSIIIEFTEAMKLDFLSTKLNDLKVLLVYKDAVGDANSRAELYQVSLSTFMGSPLYGLLLSGKATLKTIGYHSEFFDVLGSFGLVGLLVTTIAFCGYGYFVNKHGHEFRRELRFIFIGFVALFVFNPVFGSPQIFAGAFLYPLLASRYMQLERFSWLKNKELINYLGGK